MKCFVIPVIIGATGIVTKGLKKLSGNNTKKAFNRFSTENSCTRNITHCKESATIKNLKPEWWGSPLVQEEKYQEKPVEREYEIIINFIHCLKCLTTAEKPVTSKHKNEKHNKIQQKQKGGIRKKKTYFDQKS
jgi:hypothetical protein